MAEGEAKDANLGLRIVVAVLVTTLVGGFDILLARAVAAAHATGDYRETPGEVLSSAVRRVRHTGNDSDTFAVVVSYAYSVDGRPYEGHRYEATESSQSGSWAAETVARLGAGVAVPVYYDAADPSRAVLVRGVNGSDILWPLMLVPFNLMVFGLWSGVWLVGRSLAARRPYIDPAPGPWTWALLAMGLSALVLTAIVAIAFSTHPPLAVVEVAWALVPVLSLAAFVAARLRGARTRIL
jgi:hypothetical protein